LRILMLGDVIGKPGRRAVHTLLPEIKSEHGVELAIANGENAAGGLGLTPETADELFQSGVDIITSGNHIWSHKSIIPALDSDLAILRPLNYPPGVPGRGYFIKGDVMAVNLLGRTFIGNYDCPFKAMEQLLAETEDNKPPIIIVDFHAEATSEKGAMGRYLDGKVSAVLGTHTHVGTADARLLPQGTAFITDIGMVGPRESVIGDDIDAVIHRFLTQIPHRIAVGKGDAILNSVLVEIDQSTGKAKAISRIDRELTEKDE
jgi:2',3'-cyclic-nucleotide 2'-phosphodiesterase